jgi:hypothetical protein
MSNQYFSTILEIEDSLQEAGVFVNGIEGRNASMMAYMTCIEFNTLEQWLRENFAKYDVAVWLECLEYWTHFSYLSPIPKLLVGYIKRTRNFQE